MVFWLRAEGFQGITETRDETFMGGFACCLLVVFLCSLLISGCGGGDHHEAKMKAHGGTCHGEAEVYETEYDGDSQYSSLVHGYQSKDCVCPTNNTCTWSHDGVCDEASGVCAEGTDCEDCGTCNWYRCVSKAEVPKPTTLDKCENWTQAPLPTPSPTPPPTPPRPTCCLNTCAFANDAVCQDGGPGSVDSSCGMGTDCDDCGVRCR